MRYLLPAFLLLFLQACVLGTAVDVVTAPVKVASKAVDAVTTSQSEADEKRGKKLRQQEERLGKLKRQQDKQLRKCKKSDQKACKKADDIGEDINAELSKKI